jgi:hypothetical protein
VKAGIPGLAIFAALVFWPLLLALRARGSMQPMWVAAWGGIVVMMLTQSFAVIGYAPFALGTLIACAEHLFWSRRRDDAR